ncbi:MAG: AAA family ATPase [Candidatus Hydrogenedentes bacterium]|nr:AAA family ATPase [Candidatus Hydrogenedentota bacterium]
MLRRLYVHNFRTLVNFSIEFQEMNLFLGGNGSGKSSVFDVLYKLRNFLSESNPRADEVFQFEDITRWDGGQRHQQFELTLEDAAETYQYMLRVEYSPREKKCRVAAEQLLHQGKSLYKFATDAEDQARARVYQDDYTPGGEFLFDRARSGVAALQERPGSSKPMRFRACLQSLFVVKLDISAVSAEAQGEDEMPVQNMANFAAWYRHLSQTRQSQIFEFTEGLRGILPGFDSMNLVSAGESKLLNVEFRRENGGSDSYRFSELSDGQRTLILLYALLYCLPRQGAVLCLDEPENFLALPEIQFWLDSLESRVLDGSMQAVLISHHPRLINLLAGDAGQWFYREGAASPTRIAPVTLDNNGGLPASKLVELGWLVNE